MFAGLSKGQVRWETMNQVVSKSSGKQAGVVRGMCQSTCEHC